MGLGAAITAALAMLVVGAIVGFALGRSTSGQSGEVAVATSSTTTTQRVPPPADTIPQAPPAPPGTDLAPATIGTFEDPIPAGQSYVLGLYEIEVVTWNEDAAGALLAHNPSNPPAPEGQRHVIAELAVSYTDATGLGSPSAVPLFLSDGTTEWYSFSSQCGFVPNDLTQFGFLEFGDRALGNVCFTIPEDAIAAGADGLRLGTDGFAGPVYFALEP